MSDWNYSARCTVCDDAGIICRDGQFRAVCQNCSARIWVAAQQARIPNVTTLLDVIAQYPDDQKAGGSLEETA